MIARWRTALSATATLTALAAPAVATAASKNVYRVQLDTDAPREEVRIERRACRDRGPCTRLVLRDGGRRRAVLTPISQRPDNSFNWSVSRVAFHDLTGDGQPEVIWTLSTVGGTGSSPSRTGVHTYNGTRARQIFDHRTATAAAEPGYEGVIGVRSRVLEEEGELAELELREGLLAASDATCCPSAHRFTRYRFDGTRLALVAGSKRIQKV